MQQKRDYNQAAGYLTSKPLNLSEVLDTGEMLQLEQVSNVHEKLMKPLVVLNESAKDEGVVTSPSEVQGAAVA